MGTDDFLALGTLAFLGLAGGSVYLASRISALGLKLVRAEARLAALEVARPSGVEVSPPPGEAVAPLVVAAPPPPPIVVASPPPVAYAWPPSIAPIPVVATPPTPGVVVQHPTGRARGSLEERIGKRWTTWVGAVALIIAAGMFINLAAARGWLGPAARTGLAAALGTALIGVGERKKAMRALSQGLLGGGVAILYVAVYAGFARYGVYGHGVGFAALLAVTVLGMVLALRHDASPIAFLALLGGLLAPVLISDGHDRRDALFLYLVVLDLGVLAVASSKSWRALEVMALFGTWSLYGGWYALYGASSGRAPTLGWLFVFHGIFVVLPFVRHLRRRMELELVTFVKALSGALVGLGFSAHVLADRPHVLGGVALALAGSYLAMGAAVRTRIPSDTRAIAGFFALVIGFATLAVALLLGGHATTIGWAIEGPVLLVLGYRFASPRVRVGGVLAFALALGHLILDFDQSPVETPFFNLEVATGLMVSLALATYAWLHHRRGALEPQDRVLAQITGIGAGALALVLGTVEIVTMFPGVSSSGPELALVTAWWVLGALAYLTAARLLDSRASHASAACALVVAALSAVIAMSQVAPGAAPFVNARVIMALVVAATGLLVARDGGTLGRVPACVLAVWAWAILGVEAGQQFTAHAPVAVAMTWTIVAVVCALVGRVRARTELQLVAGLAIAGAACAAVASFENLAPDATAFVNLPFATLAAIVVVALAIARDLRRARGFELVARALVIGALLAAWGGLGAETYVHFPRAAQLALTIAWMLYAAVLVAAGFVTDQRHLRLAGLALLAALALKLPLIDLAGVDQLVRIGAFLVAGLAMIGVSYLYHRVDRARDQVT